MILQYFLRPTKEKMNFLLDKSLEKVITIFQSKLKRKQYKSKYKYKRKKK